MVAQFQTVSGVPNTPYQVTVYPTDPRFSMHLNMLGAVYAQDSWTHKRMTVTGGLRFDYVSQKVLGSAVQAGTFETIPAYGDIPMPVQKNWSPRMSTVIDLF